MPLTWQEAFRKPFANRFGTPAINLEPRLRWKACSSVRAIRQVAWAEWGSRHYDSKPYNTDQRSRAALGVSSPSSSSTGSSVRGDAASPRSAKIAAERRESGAECLESRVESLELGDRSWLVVVRHRPRSLNADQKLPVTAP